MVLLVSFVVINGKEGVGYFGIEIIIIIIVVVVDGGKIIIILFEYFGVVEEFGVVYIVVDN